MLLAHAHRFFWMPRLRHLRRRRRLRSTPHLRRSSHLRPSQPLLPPQLTVPPPPPPRTPLPPSRPPTTQPLLTAPMRPSPPPPLALAFSSSLRICSSCSANRALTPRTIPVAHAARPSSFSRVLLLGGARARRRRRGRAALRRLMHPASSSRNRWLPVPSFSVERNCPQRSDLGFPRSVSVGTPRAAALTGIEPTRGAAAPPMRCRVAEVTHARILHRCTGNNERRLCMSKELAKSCQQPGKRLQAPLTRC